MSIKTKTVIESQEWDKLVSETYGRPYCFQQQGGCMGRGNFEIQVPCEAEDFDRDSVPEKVNAPEMGVSFKAWLARDPNQKLSDPTAQKDYSLGLWWERNFYPSIEMVANDLHAKGLLPSGKYIINVDW